MKHAMFQPMMHMFYLQGVPLEHYYLQRIQYLHISHCEFDQIKTLKLMMQSVQTKVYELRSFDEALGNYLIICPVK